METNSSGEELVIKSRKPYTITKQREKWTEEEHYRFLEALKLYGRAWQRIEDHIGTKTAVQIRSHAQKFFSKLEKEALAKGISPGQVHDIDIPPPRPKRKPSSPYPRKSSIGHHSVTNEQLSQSFSFRCMSKLALDMQTGIPDEKVVVTKGLQSTFEDSTSSEIVNVLQETPASFSSTNKGSPNNCVLMDFLHPTEKMIKNASVNKSVVHLELSKEVDEIEAAVTEPDIEVLEGNYMKTQVGVCANASKFQSSKPSDISQDTRLQPKQNPTHPMVQTVARGMESGDCIQNRTSSNVVPSVSPAISGIQAHQNIAMMSYPFVTFSPFPQWHGRADSYRPFLSFPSAFSNPTVPTLLQNPAIHAAENRMTSIWSSSEVVTPVHSKEIPEKHQDPSPSMAAIAAATVAAAAAWWATHGLLPWFPPPFGFSFSPAAATTEPTMDTKHATGCEDTIQMKGDPANSLDQHETPKQSSKSLSLSSDSDSERDNFNYTEVKDMKSNNQNLPVATGTHDSEKAKFKKKQYRSSCGSNTPSSSDVETETAPKHEKLQDEVKKSEACFSIPSAVETVQRRLRSSGTLNDSWKEVSEEGRLAFQALFKRDVLPQSFSPPHTEESTKMMKEELVTVDLNCKFPTANVTTATNDDNNLHCLTRDSKSISSSSEHMDQGSMTNQTGYGKLKVRRTGFKPYKRCSMEAQENKTTYGEENSNNKRLRLHGEP